MELFLNIKYNVLIDLKKTLIKLFLLKILFTSNLQEYFNNRNTSWNIFGKRE